MDKVEAARLIRVVRDGMVRFRPEQEVIDQLVVAGVPADKAPALFATIKQGLLAGAQAEFTAGDSAPDGPPEDPLLAEAFRVGQEALRDSGRLIRFERLALPAALVLLIVIVFLGKWLGWWWQ